MLLFVVNFSLQISARLRKELAASNLQLLREYTFNTPSEAKEAVDLLRVSEYFSYNIDIAMLPIPQNSPARITFLNMYSVHAAEVLCQVRIDIR